MRHKLPHPAACAAREEVCPITQAELFLIALGLSADAFAVAVCKGLSLGRTERRHMLFAGAYFGVFQALAPLLGYLLGRQFEGLITAIDHWIAFGLLGAIGGHMILDSFSGREEPLDASLRPAAMLPLALATSIDALAMGVTFAFLRVDIALAAGQIGAITFILTALGLKAGSIFGLKWRGRAELFGGSVLALMGLRILLQHLGMIP